jgi:hypothetical protein
MRDNRALIQPSRILLDLAAGQLEPEEIEAVELMVRAEGLTEPPPWVLRRAERIATQRKPGRWARVSERIVAALTFDSRTQPQFVGLRASQTQVRRLLFQADRIEVDLEMTPRPGTERVRLMGQVTAGGTDPSGGAVSLSNDSQEWLARLDESGEFLIEDLERGAYRLEVAIEDRVVEVPNLPI